MEGLCHGPFLRSGRTSGSTRSEDTHGRSALVAEDALSSGAASYRKILCFHFIFFVHMCLPTYGTNHTQPFFFHKTPYLVRRFQIPSYALILLLHVIGTKLSFFFLRTGLSRLSTCAPCSVFPQTFERMTCASPLCVHTSGPRLWKLLAEQALEALDLNMAEKAFVLCGRDAFHGVRLVKRLSNISDR